MEYFKDALKRYAEFSGRATRQQYWMFFLFYILFYVGIVIVESVLGIMFISVLYTLGMLVPAISIATRRLHDTDRSGWWQLIALIPLIGWIILIVLLALPGKEDNQFGPAPAGV